MPVAQRCLNCGNMEYFFHSDVCEACEDRMSINSYSGKMANPSVRPFIPVGYPGGNDARVMAWMNQMQQVMQDRGRWDNPRPLPRSRYPY
jgi:hypothetical protein